MAYEDIDWTKADELLQQAQQQARAPAPQQDAPNTWQQAMDTVQRYQQQSAANTPQRSMPADEAPPEKDDSKTYWAMALSLLGNRGRDLGGIMQSSADDYNKRLGAWEQRNSPDAKMDRQLKLAQLQQADRAPAAQAFQEANQLAGTMQADNSAKTQQDQFNRKQLQEATLAQATQAGEKARLEYTQQGLNQRTADELANARTIASASQSGMNVRQLGEIQAQNDRQTQLIEANRALEEQRVAGALAAKQLELTGKQKPPPTGVVVDDPQRVNSLTDSERTEADKALSSGRAVNANINRLNALWKEKPTAANEKEYNSIILALVGEASKTNETGTLQNPEFLRTVKNLPAYGTTAGPMGRGGQIDSPRAMLDVMRGGNPALDALAQVQAQYNSLTNEKLRGYGFHDQLTAPQAAPQGAPRQAAAAQTPAPAAAPFDPVKLGLPGTFQRVGQPQQAAAPAPAAMPQQQDPNANAMPQMPPQALDQSGAARMPSMVGPGGQLKQPVSPREYQQLLQAGWQVIGN
jgi:hypothetical protein